MTRQDNLAYLAGVMDSDGWFSIKKSTNGIRKSRGAVTPTYHARIGAKQVRPEAIRLLARTFGGSIRVEPPSAENGRPLYSWHISDAKAEAAVRRLMACLRVKKRQAMTIIRLRRIVAEGRTGVYPNVHRDRWGRERVFRNHCYSPGQVSRMDALYHRIRDLNDTRHDPGHWPI